MTGLQRQHLNAAAYEKHSSACLYMLCGRLLATYAMTMTLQEGHLKTQEPDQSMLAADEVNHHVTLQKRLSEQTSRSLHKAACHTRWSGAFTVEIAEASSV